MHRIENLDRALQPSDHITGFMQYIRRGGNRRRGVFVAQFDHKTQEFRVGWSLANVNHGDKFDARRGLEIAFDRMTGRTGMWLDWTEHSWRMQARCMPDGIVDDFKSVLERLQHIYDSSGRTPPTEAPVVGRLVPVATEDAVADSTKPEYQLQESAAA